MILASMFISASLFAAPLRLDDRTSAPTRSVSEIEKVARFEMPPGHVSISRGGRIFMDALASEWNAKYQVIELVGDRMIPFPAAELQSKFKTIHGLHVDAKDRLWILDHAWNGVLATPHLYGYDIATGEEIVNYAFPSEVVGTGSMINDVVVDTTREKLFISETSPIAKKPGIVVFDIATRVSRRILDDHPSLRDSGRPIFVEGKRFTVLGVVHPTFGVDGIALDPSARWLYYAAFTSGELYRVPVDKAVDPSADLNAFVEKVSDITMSDGIMVDEAGGVYLSDVEHSAIVRSAGGRLETLFKDPQLSWPTGYSRSSDGWIYFTCNAIQDTKLRSRKTIVARGPYFLYRFRP